MKTQLNVGPVYGTLPILYVFLARTGKSIHAVSFVSLDDEGNIEAADESGSTIAVKDATQRAIKRGSHNVTKGVKIVYSDGTHSNQTLYYYSTDLSDYGVRRSGFLAFCNKLGVADSFIKSASYLMHRPSFTTVRNFLLGHSAVILQDDSGIPIVYFEPRKWRLQPFGRYVGPISRFVRYDQPMMPYLFRDSIPLDFGIGYRWRRNESNLLLAVKRSPP